MTSTKKKRTYVKEKTRIAMRSNGPQKQVKGFSTRRPKVLLADLILARTKGFLSAH
jgi:hypothetical protein